MYVGLWSRVADLQREAVTRGLERRSLVQATLMRVTIHLASARDFWPIALAVRTARQERFVRSRQGAVAPDALARAAETLRPHLEGGATLRRTEVEALVGKEESKGVGLWLDLVRVPPAGTWERRRADVFGLASDWLGPPPEGLTAADGVELLVRRYLTGFGPAAPAEIADWAGLGVRDVAPVLERLELRRFAAEDGTALVDLPRLPLPDAGTPAPVRFLPTWDATLLVHARRAQVLPEEHRSKVFHVRMPQSVGTVLVDGQVAATWRPDGGRIAVEPFGRWDAAVRRAVDAEAERLTAFVEDP